ncbi:MAG TPA: cardiolipin synthase [Candidatus Polarisedimenticolaceae bacterium]|nr:cardiolipin synthase [Candidatus Polarisedimenticolaceae bacterium]
MDRRRPCRLLSASLNTALAAAAFLVALVAAGHALLNKRDPRAALGWITVSLLFPLVGPVLYFVFGINRISTRAQKMGHRWSRLSQPHHVHPSADAEEREERDIPAKFTALARVSRAVTGLPLARRNLVVPFENGEGAYTPMVDAIDEATSTVYLETYIFETDGTGRRFIDALARAARRGLDVRVLIDGIGALYSRPRASSLLRRHGIRVARFLPPRLLPPSLNVNLRNHRKILVIDGHRSFTGGMNIGGRHMVSDPANRSPTVDLHFRVDGPVVRQLEDTFLADWGFATGDPPPERRNPLPEPAGDALCRVILDGPDEDLGKLATVINGAISAARSRVAILSPYFLPPREMTSALQAAALRGVDVMVVLPEKSNLRFVDWATRNMLWELLERGVDVFYQPPPFAHTKLLLVDDHYVQVGSANMDPRSLRLNFEFAVEVYDSRMGRVAAEYVDRIVARSRRVTLDEVDSRSLPVRLRDSVAWLFQPYL